MSANVLFLAPPLPLLKLLRSAWKTILAGGIVGVVLAGGYLAVSPPQYEARALISMAQIPVAGNASNGSVSTVTNIEDPVFLIERLKVPSTYTPEAIAACGMGKAEMPAEEVAGLIRAILPRSVGSVILIKVRRESPQLAAQCVNGLFEMIRAQQAEKVKPMEDDLKGALADLEARHSSKQGDLDKAEKQGLYQSVFLAKRDELLFLSQQIYTLRRATQRMMPTALVSPIYAGANPVAPQRSLVLIVATLVGLFGGLLLAVGFREAAHWSVNGGGASK